MKRRDRTRTQISRIYSQIAGWINLTLIRSIKWSNRGYGWILKPSLSAFPNPANKSTQKQLTIKLVTLTTRTKICHSQDLANHQTETILISMCMVPMMTPNAASSSSSTKRKSLTRTSMPIFRRIAQVLKRHCNRNTGYWWIWRILRKSSLLLWKIMYKKKKFWAEIQLKIHWR